MSIQLPAPTHRKRVVPQAELEAASILKLGEDQNTHTLSISEARLVINKVIENKRRGGKKYDESEYVSFPFSDASSLLPVICWKKAGGNGA
jgi:DNA-directed RNA polymerase II subunit RPB4